ncbi:uncharacterized protein LOC143573832 [Bidens hawaiensis]|uniref:uncharacterized protein LOC143573832 n=1 Tax=Bidens hawaiensis TaxID=980011 RepID=UPI00404B5E3F
MGHSGKGKRRDYEDEEWKSEPVIFPRIKGGPCNKNPLIITAEFGHYWSQYVFFDTGSTSDIMYEPCFEQLDDEDKERLQPIHAPVSGFGGEIMHPRGVITFPVTLSDGHDIILGREAIGDFNAHPSTAYGAVGVPTRTGVAIIHVNRHCFATESSRPSKVPRQAQRTEPEKWILNKKFPDQTPADMTGFPRSILEHKLKVNPLITPMVYKKRKMVPEQTKAMNEQVQDLLHAGIIREIKYQTWVANPVIVPKSNGT